MPWPAGACYLQPTRVHACRAFLTEDVRLDRPKHMKLPSTNERTWRTKLDAICQFLGFVHTHFPTVTVSLTAFRDHFATAFLSFVSFLKDRGVEGQTFHNTCNTGEHYLMRGRWGSTHACIGLGLRGG